MRWGEANRSLWPNSEVHEESLPAMPTLFFFQSAEPDYHRYSAVVLRIGINMTITQITAENRLPHEEATMDVAKQRISRFGGTCRNDDRSFRSGTDTGEPNSAPCR